MMETEGRMTTTTQPRITFDGNAYRLDGQPLPRVSDILAVINKPGLNAWRARVGNEEADRISQAAAGLGTRIHAACESLARELLVDGVGLRADAIAEELQPYLDVYERFLAEQVVEVLSVEQRVYHEAHRYAGTIDLLARLRDGRVCVLDIKTGKTVDGTTHPLQLAAYATALESMGQPVDGRYVLHLPANKPGTLVRYDFSDGEKYDPCWRAAVRLHRHYEATKDHWRTLKGEVL